MAVPLFTGNVIAVLWDFDRTLIRGYQQKPLLEEYGIEEEAFWAEVGGLVDYYKARGVVVSEGTAYLNHLLTYVRDGTMRGLTNNKLRELGGSLDFYPGIPELLEFTSKAIYERPESQRHGITVEHYVISTGLRQMILGSAVEPFIKNVWACEFIEQPAPARYMGREVPDSPPSEITQVGYFLDDTTKTRAVWEINKGVNIEPEKIRVNDLIAPEDRRVPIRNMLYVADGPSDIPIFSILNQYGGRTLGVFDPASEKHFRAVKRLRDQERVQQIVEADYRPDSLAYRWILASLEEIAELIASDRDAALSDRVRSPSGHVL